MDDMKQEWCLLVEEAVMPSGARLFRPIPLSELPRDSLFKRLIKFFAALKRKY